MQDRSLYVTIAIFLFGAIAVEQAQAQEQEQSAMPFNWSGMYFGGHAGYTKASGALTDSYCDGVTPGNCVERDPESPFFGLPGTYIAQIKSNSFIGGIHIGYNHQSASGIVIGVEGDLEFGRRFQRNFHFGKNFGLSDSESEDDVLGKIKLGLSGSARTRIGFAADRWLPFLTGGIAFAKYEATASYLGEENEPEYPRSGNGNLVGFAVGGGVNYALSQNVILGAEYRYTDFGKDFVGLANPANDSEEWGHVGTLKTHDLRLSISYKF